jgi:hypothetical protein
MPLEFISPRDTNVNSRSHTDHSLSTNSGHCGDHGSLIRPAMISVDNLTVEQLVLCQLLWDCDSTEEVRALIEALPSPWQQQAQSLYSVMIAEYTEQQQLLPDISDLLRKYHSK